MADAGRCDGSEACGASETPSLTSHPLDWIYEMIAPSWTERTRRAAASPAWERMAEPNSGGTAGTVDPKAREGSDAEWVD